MRTIFAAALSFCCMSLSAATFTVTTTAPSGPGSLGQAIKDADANPGLDTIGFAIGSGPQTIAMAGSFFNPITDAVIIDGTTQPGYAGSPIIEIDATGALSGDLLLILTSGSTIKGLVINRLNGNAITLVGDNNTVQSNFIGTDITGNLARPNVIGVFVAAGTNNLIGGSTPATRNVISGNIADGVTVATTATHIEGNYIGTNAAGTAAIPGGGLGVDVVGGATNTSILRNVISANAIGISVSGAGTNGTTITGNFIGTNATGTAAIANTSSGIRVALGAANTVIGGTTAAERNVISGNTSRGIQVNDATTTSVQVVGNYIGVNAAGTAAIKNGSGVQISNGSAITIGGTAAGAGNLLVAQKRG